MPKLVLLLLMVGLSGCVTEQKSALPMALAPSDSAHASCLTYGDMYGDMPAFGDCEGAKSLPPEQNGH